MQKLLIIYFTTFFGLTLLAQPANDLCTNAQQITNLDGTCSSFSNVGATATNPYYPNCFSTGGGNSQLGLTWFQFTADGPNADITMSGIDRPEIALIGLNNSGGTDLCDINDVLQYGCTNPNGNYTSTTLSINNNSLVPGDTYLIAVLSNTQSTFDLCIDNPINTSPSTCANAQPFCTADGNVTYDAGVDDGVAEPGNDYNCLVTQPNPAWFFLEIDDPGDLDLSFTSSPAEDIDFVAWGPFADQTAACDNLTTANVVDCSFLAATSETASITGTQTGEVYMVMITNFSNNPTQITFSQTGGAATTNCAIVLPVSLLNFSGGKINHLNELWWTTASETNNDYFILEHSIDGKQWKEIQKIDGAGSSSTENTYGTTHRDFEAGVNYYRLKQVDFDGTVNTHNIISINNTEGRVLLKRVNSMGQEVNDSYNGMVIEYYDDGSTRKVMQ